MHRPNHGDGALRRHRINQTGASYFVTVCTTERRAGLVRQEVADALRGEIEAIQASGHWRLRGAVIMPDHLHLLVVMRGELSISRCVGRLKAKTKGALTAAKLEWQGNFYEHRLRPDESAEPVLRYLHLNRYREKLVAAEAVWPGFWLGDEEAAWFAPMLDDGKPFPEWLR